MRIIFSFLMIAFFTMIGVSCKNEKSNDLILVNSDYGNRKSIGTISKDSVRVGMWTFISIDSNSIDSFCYYSIGEIVTSQLLENGRIFQRNTYSGSTLDSQIITNYLLYRSNKNLIMEEYSPDTLEGRAIFRENCNGCHYIKTGKEIMKILPNYQKFFIAKNLNKPVIKLSKNSLSIKDHFFFETLNNEDLESIKLFLNSDKLTRSY